MSKRKVNLLVKKNYVKGRDHYRLYTLIALRWRGISAVTTIEIGPLGSLSAKVSVAKHSSGAYGHGQRHHE
jgi:glutamyl/glutaminyl-tRNA synthetase